MTDFFQKIDIDAEGEIGWDQFSDFVSTARAQSQDDVRNSARTELFFSRRITPHSYFIHCASASHDPCILDMF